MGLLTSKRYVNLLSTSWLSLIWEIFWSLENVEDGTNFLKEIMKMFYMKSRIKNIILWRRSGYVPVNGEEEKEKIKKKTAAMVN